MARVGMQYIWYETLKGWANAEYTYDVKCGKIYIFVFKNEKHNYVCSMVSKYVENELWICLFIVCHIYLIDL